MSHPSAPADARLPSLGWAAFVVLALIGVLIASGVPIGPLLLLGGSIGILFAYRYTYATYALFLLLIPMLGLTITIPTGELAIGRRAFGGSIDVWVCEAVAALLLGVWAIKITRWWVGRNDSNWKPWLPLLLPMLGIVATHILSALSVFQPDKLLVIKYALRPVFWSYLVYVLLTVNFIRSRRTLVMALSVVMGTGVFAALMGLAALGIPEGAFPRARPLPLFGLMPMGDNHNLLAEWLAITIPSTLALFVLLPARLARERRLLIGAFWLQLAAGLLTFSRTLWIVLTLQSLAAAFLIWRTQAEQWLRKILVGIVLLLPVAALMFNVSSTAQVASSTSTRLLLTQISLNLWQASPWIGVGAGTFVERVGSTWIFVTEHGAPLDSHGLIQKLLAETGILGLAAFAVFVAAAVQYVLHARTQLQGAALQAFTLLALSAGGALIYQLFNTNYWTGKLWLPIGLMLAAGRALTRHAEESS